MSDLVVQRLTSTRATPLVAFALFLVLPRQDVSLAKLRGAHMPTRGAAEVRILGACYRPFGADEDLTSPTTAEHGSVLVLRTC